ncbi:MAG: hypothetical protein KAI47_21015 [Deltaproteobacteria bacterium]|nr:hypothetical protein [Deltaproteobacteria bacterium]
MKRSRTFRLPLSGAGLAIATLLLSVVGLGACKEVATKEATSLSMDPGKDPGLAKTPLTMVWHHHSTGDRILQGGLLAALKADHIVFYDINYKEAKVGDYVIGDKTNPPDFPKNFNTSQYFDVIKSWELKDKKKQHDVIMFKSCYPASQIDSDAKLEAYKGYYKALLPMFKSHPDILFIAMSTPPLVRRDTKKANALRARRWAKWVTTVYAKDLKNVQVFDLFNALAIREGFKNANTLVPQFAHDKWDSHPNVAGAKAVTRMFIPWFNRALRAAGKTL